MRARKAPAGRPTIWHVAFMRSKREHIIDALSPAGFRHVLCFGFVDETNSWLIVDPTAAAIEVASVPAGEAMTEIYLSMLKEGATIVRIPQGADMKPLENRLLLTCVSVVKRTIGARSGALRPIGLFRDLLRQGGTILFLKGEHREIQGEGPG